MSNHHHWGKATSGALQEQANCASFWSAAEKCNGSAAFPFSGSFQYEKIRILRPIGFANEPSNTSTQNEFSTPFTPGAFHLERLRSDMTSGMRMKSFAELSARQRSVLD
jgi:hypothetical protein